MIRKSRILFFLLFCIVCFSFFSLSANGQSEDLFTQANEAVLAEDFNKAISIYEQILENDQVSPELYSNLGHAHFMKKEYPKAKLYFEKGLKMSPHHSDLKTNMKNVNTYLVSDISQLDDFFLLTWWNGWKSLLSSSIWSLFSLLALGLALFGLAHYLLKWNRISKSRSFWFMGLGLGLFLLFTLTANSKYHAENDFQFAILMEGVQLKSGPESRSNDLRELQPGEKMEILDSIGEWYKIALRNKSTGWVETKNLSLI